MCSGVGTGGYGFLFVGSNKIIIEIVIIGNNMNNYSSSNLSRHTLGIFDSNCFILLLCVHFSVSYTVHTCLPNKYLYIYILVTQTLYIFMPEQETSS